MAFQLGDEEQQGMNEMNLIPLIDIMLVLMIIFLVTATVLNPTVPLDLPNTSATVNEQPPTVIQISIDKEGQLYWDKEKLSLDELKGRFSSARNTNDYSNNNANNISNNNANAQDQQPSIQLRADKEARYDMVAQVLAVASETGLTKIAFVNE